MNDLGWIRIDRDILKTDLWKKNEPFDCRSAYLDLYLMANFKDSDVETKHGVVHVKRGQVYTSVCYLSEKWQWSRNKIYRFFGTLKRTGIVTTNGTPDGTLITLIKYGFLEYDGTTDGTTDGTSNGTTDGTQHNKDNKKDKKNNNILSIPDPEEELFDKLWSLYPRKEGKASVSKKTKHEIYKIGYDRMAAAIAKYKQTIIGREMKYVKMGSSFFNTNYVEFLEEEKEAVPAPETENKIPKIFRRIVE